MLKQDAVPEPPSSVPLPSIPSPPVPSPSVAQARVTPDELASALAAIEARRQAEAAHLAGTIPIDQAVSDLHLDSTPDEIWAEVKTQRDKAAAAQQKPTPVAYAAPPQAVTPPRSISRRGLGRLIAPVLVIGVLMSTGVIPKPWSYFTSAAPHHSTAAPILRSLASIPVDQEVYADDFALTQISQGKPAAQITVSRNLTGNRWPVVKRSDHHIYVRGYTERADSVNDLQGKPLNVYNDDNSSELQGDTTSNITLRVDNIPFQKSSGTDTFSGITFSNFQPDPSILLTPGR